MPDAARAYRVLDLIQKYPDQHSQATWFKPPPAPLTIDGLISIDLEAAMERRRQLFSLDEFTGRCGTAACLAGWTVLEAGYQLNASGTVVGQDLVGYTSAASMAGYLLGIDGAQATLLFYGINDDQLPEAIAQVFGSDPRERLAQV